MADELNAAGHRTPRGRPFTAESVRQLLARGGPSPAQAAARASRRKRPVPRFGLEPLSQVDHRGQSSRTTAGPGGTSPGLWH